MPKFISTIAASAVLALFATPAMAQDEPEEARTTYSVTMLKFADDADDRWNEIMTDYVIPAQVAAGQTPDVVHWVMVNPDYDIVVVSEMEGGMAGFDSHMNPHRAAFVAALTEIVGSQEALDALSTEMDGLVEKSTTLFTHTHP